MVNWVDQKHFAREFFTSRVHEDDFVPSFAVSRALGVGNKRLGTFGIPRRKILGVWCYRKRDVLEYLERTVDDPANPYFVFRQKVRARWDRADQREDRGPRRYGFPPMSFISTAQHAKWFAAQEAKHRRWESEFRQQYDATLDELEKQLKYPGSAHWATVVQDLDRRLMEIRHNEPDWEFYRELAERQDLDKARVKK